VPLRTGGGRTDIIPLPAALGARVEGLTAAEVEDLPAETVEQLRKAWAEHLLLLFPGIGLDPAQQVALARHFGSRLAATTELGTEPGSAYYQDWRTLADDGHPEVLLMDTELGHNAQQTNLWHSDVSFVAEPPIGSLFCMEIPASSGGDTMWSNQYLAYEGLSEPIRALVDGLRASHGRPHKTGLAVHPVVRRHEVTGRPYLFVNRGWIWAVEGLSKVESRHVVDLLLESMERPEYQVRWRWSAGDAALWDNRCALHYAVNDYGGERRRSRRTTIYG
jgi:taurine dioxygenase